MGKSETKLGITTEYVPFGSLRRIVSYFMSLLTGVGDFQVKEIRKLSDPCPLPEKDKKRSLNEKEKLLYAPMCGVGGVMYDKVRARLYFMSTKILTIHGTGIR